jgi:uracil phosphoribosyltransferase
MVHILSTANSILNQYIAEIRDAEIQKDSLRFRRNLERLGGIFAYEISKELTRDCLTSLINRRMPLFLHFAFPEKMALFQLILNMPL